MAKNKDKQQEQQAQLEKLEKRGIVFEVEPNNYYRYNGNMPPDCVIDYFNKDKTLSFKMHFKGDVIAIVCDDLISFKLLNLNTIAFEAKFSHKIICFFKYEKTIYEQLKKELNSDCIEIVINPVIYFNPTYIPKLHEKKDEYFTYDKLPRLSHYLVKEILKTAKDLETHKGYHFQINHGKSYRISTLTCQRFLSYPILTVNEKKVLESLLLCITNSTYVLDTSKTDMEFKIPFKTFRKELVISRKNRKIKESETGEEKTEKETEQEVITNAFDKLIYLGLLDGYSIDENTHILTFTASQLASGLTNQNVHREYGFYGKIPGTKKARILAAWLDYLWIILTYQAKDKILKTGLHYLLERLDLTSLLDKHRIKDIADWLNTLKDIGIKYNLLIDNKGKENKEPTFNSKIVKLLLNGGSLNKYMLLNNAHCGKDGRKNG